MITTLPAHLMPMVEKAAKALWETGSEFQTVYEECAHLWQRDAEAAILAFLNACLDGGVAREAMATTDEEMSSRWNAISETKHVRDDSDFPALILSLGEAK